MNILKVADNQNPQSVSSELRNKRFKYLLETLNINSLNSILDVGGTEAIWHNTGLEENVTLLNN